MPALDVVTRHPANPIVTRDDFPVPLEGAYNSGCVKLTTGRYLMAARVNEYNQRTAIWLLDSDDGIAFTPRPQPMAVPQTASWQRYADSVIYDPRMTIIEDTGELLMTMACHSALGCRIATFRACDHDGRDWEFVDYQGIPCHRNTVYFPRKINGLYAVLDRPNLAGNGGGNGGIWIKCSPDLRFWGAAERICGPGDFLNHAAGGLGAGAPPILTERGWLCIIHCVMPAANTLIYSVGAMILDRDDPTRMVAKAPQPIMVPDAPYEMLGLVPSVCFPCGAVVEDDGEVKIYYGGADRVTALGISSIDRLLAACSESC